MKVTGYRTHFASNKMSDALLRQAGFSLIELMVSVALFAVVMMVSVGGLLALIDANRKARALESVVNNLNIALDGMVRSTRMGSAFNCNSVEVPVADMGGDCSLGDDLFSLAPFGSNPNVQTERWVYSFEEGQILRSRDGGVTSVPITAPEVDIEDVTFYVVGTKRGSQTTNDTTQPKVVVVVKGTAGTPQSKTATSFYIQATAVQRLLDL